MLVSPSVTVFLHVVSAFNLVCTVVIQCSKSFAVFANLFYEHNNPGLDASNSNLKCSIYSDTHTAVEKTNFGGQQLAPQPAGLTFIQQSSGFSSATLVDPETPEGYELVFGPINGANNAPGVRLLNVKPPIMEADHNYSTWALPSLIAMTSMPVHSSVIPAVLIARAGHVNTSTSGARWSMARPQPTHAAWCAPSSIHKTKLTICGVNQYFIPADASTAVNTGQGSLQVTFSRGYRRTNLVIDGGFEAFNECEDFCFDTSDANWVGTSPAGGVDDATIFFFQPFAHSGNAVALLGAANGGDALAGTLTPRKPLKTLSGRQYSIGFFQASSFAPPVQEAPAFVDVRWNGATVQTIHPGFSNYAFFQVTVTAKGNDVLSFHGGAAPAWSFIDDITVFEL